MRSSSNFDRPHSSKDFVPEGSGDSETIVVHVDLEVVIGVLFLQNPESLVKYPPNSKVYTLQTYGKVKCSNNYAWKFLDNL